MLRHGEVQGGPRYRGRTDDPLTPKGWQQMERQTSDWQGDCIVSSPLGRCHSFAIELSRQRNIPLKVDQAWREIGFGDWEGKTAEQIAARDSSALQRYYEDPISHPPPNAENYADFSQRVASGWQQLLAHNTGRHVLLITHAGVIRSLFMHLLDIPFRRSLQIEIGHACLSRFKCYHDGNGCFVQLSFHLSL